MHIHFQKKQKAAKDMLEKYPVVFYGGAKGGGKSWLVRAWQILRRSKYPRTKGVIIRKTYPELLTNHIKQMWEEYPELRRYYKKADKVLELPNGSQLYFRYLQHTDDVYNYQGLEFEDISLDECTQHTEEVFKILRSSNRTTNKDIKARFLLTGNPGGVGHGWVKRMFIDKIFNEGEDSKEYNFVQAKVYDNDKLMVNDPDYVKRLESLPVEKRRAYLDGDWDVFEGQFFSEFRVARHVIKPRYKLREAPDNFQYRLTWDDGTRAPRAVYLMIQDNDGRVDVVWEYYRTEETATEAAQKIKEELEDLGVLDVIMKSGKLVYDPSMDIRSTQTGIPTSQVIRGIFGDQLVIEAGNNDREEGARRYRDYLHCTKFDEPLLKIWDTCPNLIRTLPELVYDERKKEDLDTDGEDHGYDSTRYGLMSLTKMPARFTSEIITEEVEYPESYLPNVSR